MLQSACYRKGNATCLTCHTAPHEREAQGRARDDAATDLQGLPAKDFALGQRAHAPRRKATCIALPHAAGRQRRARPLRRSRDRRPGAAEHDEARGAERLRDDGLPRDVERGARRGAVDEAVARARAAARRVRLADAFDETRRRRAWSRSSTRCATRSKRRRCAAPRRWCSRAASPSRRRGVAAPRRSRRHAARQSGRGVHGGAGPSGGGRVVRAPRRRGAAGAPGGGAGAGVVRRFARALAARGRWRASRAHRTSCSRTSRSPASTSPTAIWRTRAASSRRWRG